MIQNDIGKCIDFRVLPKKYNACSKWENRKDPVEFEKFISQVSIDTSASSDGTWQKQGHDSLDGVVTVIQNDIGKCTDYRILSKKCNACSKWENRKDS